MHPLRTALSVTDGRLLALGALAGALRFVERLALVVVAYAFILKSRQDALLYALALALLFAVRGAVTSAARSRAGEALHLAAVDAIVRGDVLRSSVMATEDAQTAVLEGIYHGGRVLSEILPDLLGDALATALFAAVLVATKPGRLLVVGTLAVLFAGTAVVFARRVTARMGERAWARYRPVLDDLIGGIGARLELAASGREEGFVLRFREKLSAWRRESRRAEALSSLAGRAPAAAAAVGVGLALLADQSLRGALTSAALADAALFASVVPAFTGLARAGHELAKGSVKVRSLLAMFAERAASAEATRGAVALPPLPARIAWREVSFAYTLASGARGPLALDRVTITWEPGRVLALEGRNGSGKSTCLRLLLGLARPSSGTIAVGDRDLFTLDARAWRRQIAYLPQRPFIPERASVREAIRLIASDASDAAMRGALERVDMWGALVAQAPEAPLDVVAATLSAGQRQRVALARVLVQESSIVLLDEPDANLDSAGIELVIRLVRELGADKMVALVAHTEAIARVADDRVRLGR